MTDAYESLLRCLRDDTARDDCVRHFTPADWDDILETARQHALAPLLYENLREQPLPAAVRDTLQRSYYASTARNLRIHVQLRDLLALLSSHDIPVIVLKGCDLAWSVYHQPGLRPMTDIDLLIEGADIARAGRLLEANGYHADTGATGASGKHATPYRHDHGVPVELHYHLAEPPFTDRIELAGIQARAVTRESDGYMMRCLSSEDRLLYLVLHTCLAHGLDIGLLPFVDMRQMLRADGQSLNHRVLVERARQWNVERALSLMLKLTSQFLEVADPALLLPSVEPAILEAAERFVLERPPRLPEGFVKTLMAGSWSSKWRIIQSRIIPAEPPGGSRIQWLERTLQRLVALVRKYTRSMLTGAFRSRAFRKRIGRERQRRDLIDWLSG